MKDEMDAPDEIDRVNENHSRSHKLEVKTKLKRGTGTRDSDTIVARAVGQNEEELEEKLEALMPRLEELAEHCRSIQPGDD